MGTARFLSSHGKGCSGSKPSAAKGAGLRFRVNDCLLGVLQRARSLGRRACIELPDNGLVQVDFEEQYCVLDLASEQEFFAGLPKHFVTRRLSRLDGQAVRPLDELTWKAAYHASNGALLEGYHPFDVVELERWPNFTRLPHAECCLPLCSILARRPTSISFAHRMLRIPHDDAMRFYSAARASGHLRLISSQPSADANSSETTPADSQAASARSGTIWSRLFSRVSGL